MIAPSDVKSVKASDPDPTRTYRLADWSLVADGGHKVFNAFTEDNQLTNLSARVTDVEKPLLSVSQVVAGGSEVIFSPKGSYISSPGGSRIPIEFQGVTYALKMWAPRKQVQPFLWQARKWL